MALRGLTGFSSHTSGYNFRIPSSPFHGVSSGSGLTMHQMLQLLHEKQQPAHRSFVGELKHGVSAAAHPVLWALDKTMRPTYAIASGADQLAQGHSVGSALHHAKLGIQGKEHTTFSKVLNDAGVLKGHRILRGIAGFGLDVAADPTTYLTFGVGGVAKNAAERAGMHVLKDTVGHVGRKEAGALATDMAAHAKYLKDAGEGFTHRANLAHVKAGLFRKQAFNGSITAADRQTLNMARAAAQAEHDASITRKLQVGYRVPGTFGKKGVKVTTGVGVPRMLELANGKIPLASSFLGSVGDKFVPGFRNPVEHAIDMTRVHSAEHLASTYLEHARNAFQGVKKMSKKRQHELLHIFEKPGGVMKAGNTYVLNPDRVKEALDAGFHPDELKLVEAMHEVGQFLHATHGQFGLDVGHLGEKGQLYVPHIFKGPENPLQVRYRNMLSSRGFRKGRANEFSLKEIEDMKAAGHLPKEIETDPFRLVAQHLRSVANEHADKSMVNFVGHHLGTPGRTVDEALLAATQKQHADLFSKLNGHSARLVQLDAAKKAAIKDVEKQATQRYQDAVRRNREQVLQHMEGEHTRTTMATIQRLSQYGTTLKAKHTAEIAAIRAGEHADVKAALKPLQAQREASQKEMRKLSAELSKVSKTLGQPARKGKAATGLYRGKATPGIGHLVELNIKDKYGHPIHVPQEIANSVARLEKVTTSHETVQQFADSYRKWLGKWKIGVTSVNPGYGVRNTLSDFWNMYLSGVPMASAVLYGGKAAKIMRAAKTGDPKAMSVLLDAYHHGILSGLFQGDVQEMANVIAKAGSKKSLIQDKRFIALYAKITQDMNRNRENWGRLTHYLYRREAQGMSITEAAKHVRAAHFDYEELTPFERNVMKSVAPFYTWTRKNIPFQIRALIETPGRYSTFPKAAIESQTAANPSGQEGIVPDYLRDGLQFQVPGGAYMAPMIGVTDLMKLDPHQARQTFASLVSPAASVPYELASNKNLFTGQPISPDNHTRVPINDRYAGLLKLIPGTDVGLTQRNGTFGQGMNPKAAFLLGQLPALNAAINGGGKIKGKSKSEAARDIAYLTGVNLTKVDQAQQEGFATANERDAFKKWEAGLKDSNPELFKLLKSKRKKSANQKLLDTALIRAQSGR